VTTVLLGGAITGLSMDLNITESPSTMLNNFCEGGL